VLLLAAACAHGSRPPPPEPASLPGAEAEAQAQAEAEVERDAPDLATRVAAILDQVAGDCTGTPDECADIVELRDECHARDAESCAQLGQQYHLAEDGLARNDAHSAALLEHACHLGDDFGCVRFAAMLDLGVGVPRDSRRALAIYHRFCETDEPMPWACFGAARSYAAFGDERDPARARHYLELGCELGEEVACEFLACMEGGAEFMDCFRESRAGGDERAGD
jgi:TPR repeat protein